MTTARKISQNVLVVRSRQLARYTQVMSITHVSVTNHDARYDCSETPEAWPTTAFRPLILLVHGSSRASRRYTFDTTHNPLRTMSDTSCFAYSSQDTKMNAFSQIQRSTGRHICTISNTIFGVNGITLLSTDRLGLLCKYLSRLVEWNIAVIHAPQVSGRSRIHTPPLVCVDRLWEENPPRPTHLWRTLPGLGRPHVCYL